MMTEREKVITEIEDALSDNLAKVGHVYRMSLNGLKDKALKDALDLLKEQEQEISFLKAMQFQTVKGMDERELGEIVGKMFGLWR